MGRAFLAFLLIGTIFGGFFYLRSKDVGLVSPAPDVFGVSKITVHNKWFPKNSSLEKKINSTTLLLSAKSAILVDYDTGKVIFAKNPEEKLPVASTVKIMTALVALENAKLSDVFTVSEKASKVGENSMGLTAGEKLSLEELLYGLMLVSGNDAAITIAEGVAGTEDEFVRKMNEEILELGLKNTKFVNSSGLDEDGKSQYSTAYDLITIAHYVWENYPEFRRITSTVHQYIEANNYHKAFDLYNDTNLLTTYPGVRGIKPGFTWEAGLCLVTYAENKQSLRSSSSTAGLKQSLRSSSSTAGLKQSLRSSSSTADLDGKKLLAVILGSDDRRGEMKELLDFGFSQYGIKIDHPALDL